MVTTCEEISATSFVRASYEAFAEDTSIPRTIAAIVVMSPVTSLATSFSLDPKRSSGMARRRTMPARPDAKIEANTIELTAIEFIRLVRSLLSDEVDPEWSGSARWFAFTTVEVFEEPSKMDGGLSFGQYTD